MATYAEDLFVDRVGEAQAFKTCLTQFRRLVDADEEVELARHNLFAFSGIGGIGKTALSERLQAWVRHELPLVNGWGSPPAAKVDASVRIDLHESAGHVELLKVLLSLRAGAAQLRRRWPLFDLAFAAYWTAVRTGEALPNIRGVGEYGELVAQTAGDLLEDLGSAAGWAIGTPVGLGVRGVRKIIGALRRRHDLRLGIDAYEGFEEFLIRCADEPSPTDSRPALACAIAATLSWELSNMDPCPLLVVFVDTTERLLLDPSRESEGHLNRLVHDTPNILWILTGREPLDWHRDGRADLPFRGPRIWPTLTPNSQEAPCQRFVDNLAPADTRALILNSRSQLGLPMSDEVVNQLAKASHGLPQYIELARQFALMAKEAGGDRAVRLEDVTGSLSSLVQTVLRDVPPDEQRAIRAACLFRAFDTNLIAAAAGVDHGAAERAAARPIVKRIGSGWFSYRLHDAVRDALRSAGPAVAGGWAEGDWELAAAKAAVAVQRLHDEAKDRQSNREVLDAIGIAVTLVCDQNTVLQSASDSTSYADWLSRAIAYSPSVEGLRSRVPSISRTTYGQYILDFIAAKSLDTAIGERVRLLQKVAASKHPLWHSASRHLGYTLNIQHRWDEALAVFDRLSEQLPTPVNIRQRPKTLSLARRFIDAGEAAPLTPVQYAHGTPERYLAGAVRGLAKFRDAGRQREYLEDLGTYVYRRIFFLGDVGDQEIEDLRDAAEISGDALAIRTALLAVILSRRADRTEVDTALRRLRTLDERIGDIGQIGFRYAFGECCDALLTSEEDRLARLHDEVRRIDFRTRNWIPVECFLAEAGYLLPEVPTQWLEPPARVQERWAAHLNKYLQRHRVGGDSSNES